MQSEDLMYGQPIRSLQTMLHCIYRNEPDCALVADGIYGKETAKTVSNFQRSHAIPCTGVTNQQTWDAVVAEYDSIRTEAAEPQSLCILMDPGTKYCMGDSCPNILLMQSMLLCIANKYNSIGTPEITGTLDQSTCECIASFQQLCGLPATGSIDKTTWKHLALQFPLAACSGSQRI